MTGRIIALASLLVACAGKERAQSASPPAASPPAASSTAARAETDAAAATPWREECLAQVHRSGMRYDAIAEQAAPFLAEGIVVQATIQSPSGAESSFWMCAPGVAGAVYDEPSFNQRVASAGGAVETPAACAALVRAFVELALRSQPLDSVDSLIAAANGTNVTDAWRQRMRRRYETKIRPVDACVAPGTVAVHALSGERLVRFDLAIAAGGAITATDTVLDAHIPIPRRL